MWSAKNNHYEVVRRGTVMEIFEGLFLMVCPSESQSVKSAVTFIYSYTSVQMFHETKLDFTYQFPKSVQRLMDNLSWPSQYCIYKLEIEIIITS